MGFIKRVTHEVRTALTKAKSTLERLIRRLTAEPAYAEAAANLVISTAAMLCHHVGLRRFIQETAQTLAALVRALQRRQGDYPEISWGIDPLWD